MKDDYNAAHSCTEILTAHGWTCTGPNGSRPGTLWAKPGETGTEHHASLGAAGVDRVKVFSTAAPIPESAPGTSYDAFGLTVWSDYGGDFRRATRELAATGRYGVPSKPAGTDTTPRPGSPVTAEPASLPTVADLFGATTAGTSPDERQETGTVTDDHDQDNDAAVIPLERGPADPPGVWAPLNLAKILAADYVPEQATMLPRDDGQCLVYPGRVHSLHGESESGKSFVAQVAAVLELMAGHDVLYLDYESDAASVVDRLRALGASREHIGEHLFYLNPEAPPSVDPQGLDMLLTPRYSLAIIDGVTDALAVSAASGLSNDDVTVWARALPKRITKTTGAAVIMVDHVVKDSDNRGRWAWGAQAKMASLTGAAYTLDVPAPMGRGLVGVLCLRIGKDRPGGVRPNCGAFHKSDRTQLAATITMNALDPDRIVVTVSAPDADDEQGPSSGEPFRPTTLMERISIALEQSAGPLGTNDLFKAVGGKRNNLGPALTALIAEGYVVAVPAPRRSSEHSSVRPYRQAADPRSDRFSPGY